MIIAVVFRDLQHSFQSRYGGCKKKIIITVAIGSAVGAINGTAKATFLQQVEEVVTVEAICEAGKDLPLANTVCDHKTCGDLGVEANIGKLVYIHKDDQAEKDTANLVEHLTKQNTELAEIKCFTFVHRATKNFTSVSEEVAYCFSYCPGTHVGRYFSLVGKLKIMEADVMAIETDYNPVNLFQN